jgi:ribosomal subunit interface protein
MNINIKFTNLAATPALSNYVIKKVSSLERLIKNSDTSAHASVEVGKTTHHHKEGGFFRAEINLHIAGSNFSASAEEEDLYAAIDKVKDEMMRELRAHKTKQQSLLRRGAAKVKKILKFGN